MRVANVVVANVCCKPNWTRLCDWLARHRPDIATLQKIGSSKPFPEKELRNVGYESRFLDHSRNYLGVAILADHEFLRRRDALMKVRDCGLPGDDQRESRFLTISIGSIWISSVYAPYGPMRKSMGKLGAIERRVAWLNLLRDHVCSFSHGCWILCGDFNVKADGPPWGSSNYSRREKDALEELGFVDAYRRVHPCVTERRGWTRGYTEKDPTKGDARLHLILASTGLAHRIRSAHVDVEATPWPRSDAPPLVVEFDGV